MPWRFAENRTNCICVMCLNFKQRAAGPHMCIFFEVSTAIKPHTVVFWVIISFVHVDGGSTFFWRDAWSHNPGNKRYVQLVTTAFRKRNEMFLQNPKSLSAIWSPGNYASVQLAKGQTRRSHSKKLRAAWRWIGEFDPERAENWTLHVKNTATPCREGWHESRWGHPTPDVYLWKSSDN
jgi:hypothetical protein